MRRAEVRVHGVRAGVLEEIRFKETFRFQYDPDYTGAPVSLTLPVSIQTVEFEGLPPFFEGLLPEGYQLEALLRALKIDRNDLFSQLLAVGADTVGAVTVRELP